jgi:hypothetical protein
MVEPLLRVGCMVMYSGGIPEPTRYPPMPEPKFEMALGDLNSTAKGTGARANAGKPDHSLLALRALGSSVLHARPDCIYGSALYHLGSFQCDHDRRHLLAALHVLGDHWDDCAKVFTYGKAKYAAWNWAKGMPWSVPLACASRHLMALVRGEALDPESNQTHEGHVFCNVVMLLIYCGVYPEGNDLPPVGLLG